jgi:hypothetical protein
MTARPWIKPLVWTLLGIGGIIGLCIVSEVAREVIGGAALNLFQVVTTPFIFEAVLVVIGVVTVLTLSQLRQEREKDEWVYLAKTEPETDGETPPHRLDAVVLKEKPDGYDESVAHREVIEGYLDLGLAREALNEIETLPDREKSAPEIIALRERAARLSREG